MIEGKGELHLVPECVVEFYLGVTRCPDGIAEGALNLRNRGHDEYCVEITCWPKHEKQWFRMGTSGPEQRGNFLRPEEAKLTRQEEEYCRILGLTKRELFTFLRSWREVERDAGERDYRRQPETLQEVGRYLTHYNIKKKKGR